MYTSLRSPSLSLQTLNSSLFFSSSFPLLLLFCGRREKDEGRQAIKGGRERGGREREQNQRVLSKEWRRKIEWIRSCHFIPRRGTQHGFIREGGRKKPLFPLFRGRFRGSGNKGGLGGDFRSVEPTRNRLRSREKGPKGENFSVAYTGVRRLPW